MPQQVPVGFAAESLPTLYTALDEARTTARATDGSSCVSGSAEEPLRKRLAHDGRSVTKNRTFDPDSYLVVRSVVLDRLIAKPVQRRQQY